MSNTKIKSSQFHGVVGHGTDGYFLMTNADGSMSWAEGGASGPSVTSVAYPGDDTAADPAGGQTVVLTGTNFGSSMSVTIGGTAAPSVAHDSSTQLTITTPAKAAGDYDIVVTNTVTGTSGTFVNGISYNGIPTWTTAAGSLGTFESETTISTITLAATEPDGGTITFNITNGALPTGLSLTGANIDGTTTAESSTTLYSFTIEAIDDENQSTPRNFSITVNSAEIVSSENFTINTYTGNGSTQSIEGKIGTAASFNGSTSHIDIPSTIPYTNTDFTFSCWFNLSSAFSSGFQTIIGAGDKSTGEGIIRVLLRYSSANNYTIEPVRAYSGNSYYTATSNYSAQTINAGTWYHLSYTYSATGNTAKIYLNGSLVSTTNLTTTSTDATNTGVLALGQYRDSNSSTNWNGKIDQVRFFNIAITDSAKISQLAAENNTSSTKSTTDIFDDGSGVALYEFEKGAIDTGVAIDSGQSASFVGTNQNYIQLPSGIDTILNTKTFGLSLWVKAPNAATDAVFSTETTNSTFQIHANWGFAGAYALINGGGSDINLGPVDSNWHHIVVTSDGSSSYKGYFDKSYKGASAYRQTSNVGTFLGAHPAGGFNLLGEIDQVRIFNRQLSQSDIDALYNETAPTTVDYFGDGNGKALYALNGTPDDESGNYDATWNGTAAYSDPALLTQYNGTATNVNYLGMAFQPDLVWVKNRFDINNLALFDSIRGREMLTTSTTNQGFTPPSGYDFTSFDSNGFTVAGSPYYININDLNDSMVAWCWKAGGNSNTYNVDDTGYSTASDAGLSSANGTTLNGASVNTQAGFSIINYETNVNGDNRPAHGLTQEPELIILKPYDTSSLGWYVMTKKIDGSLDFLFLNTSDAKIDTANSEFINSTHFRTSFGTVWGSVIAYCFHSVDGYQKVGSYTGTGSNGNTITTGFRPRFVMIKSTTASPTSWVMVDALRDNADEWLYANESSATYDDANTYTELNTNGFTVNNTASYVNASGHTYIYLAIA